MKKLFYSLVSALCLMPFLGTAMEKDENNEVLNVAYFSTPKNIKADDINYGKQFILESTLDIESHMSPHTKLYLHIYPVCQIKTDNNSNTPHLGYARIDLTKNDYEPDTKCAYINFLSIEKHFQNKGLGTVLLNNCFELCKSLGYKRVSLHVNPKNPDAKRLYEKVGFVTTEGENIRSTHAGRLTYMVKELQSKNDLEQDEWHQDYK